MRGVATMLAMALACLPTLLWPSAAVAVAIVIKCKLMERRNAT